MVEVEDVQSWITAISKGLGDGETWMSLVELQKVLGMSWGAIWLGLLLGGFQVDQQGEFYDRGGVLIQAK